MILVTPNHSAEVIYQHNLMNLQALKSPSKARVDRFGKFLATSSALGQIDTKKANTLPKNYTGIAISEENGETTAKSYKNGKLEDNVNLSKLQYKSYDKTGKSTIVASPITMHDLESKVIIPPAKRQDAMFDALVQSKIIDTTTTSQKQNAKIAVKAMIDLKEGKEGSYSAAQNQRAQKALESTLANIQTTTSKSTEASIRSTDKVIKSITPATTPSTSLDKEQKQHQNAISSMFKKAFEATEKFFSSLIHKSTKQETKLELTPQQKATQKARKKSKIADKKLDAKIDRELAKEAKNRLKIIAKEEQKVVKEAQKALKLEERKEHPHFIDKLKSQAKDLMNHALYNKSPAKGVVATPKKKSTSREF
jgi:hypothetical protein